MSSFYYESLFGSVLPVQSTNATTQGFILESLARGPDVHDVASILQGLHDCLTIQDGKMLYIQKLISKLKLVDIPDRHECVSEFHLLDDFTVLGVVRSLSLLSMDGIVLFVARLLGRLPFLSQTACAPSWPPFLSQTDCSRHCGVS